MSDKAEKGIGTLCDADMFVKKGYQGKGSYFLHQPRKAIFTGGGERNDWSPLRGEAFGQNVNSSLNAILTEEAAS